MSEIIPPGNVAIVYDTADPKMMLRIIDGAEGPGLVSLETLRQISAAVEAELAERIAALETGSATADMLTAEARARYDGLEEVRAAVSAEIAARGKAVSAEAKARSDADGVEATARIAGDKANADAVSSEATARMTGDKTNADAISTEVSARAAGDKAAGDAISAEAAARAAADKTNSDAIATEVTARAAGDKTNADGLTAEAKTRGDADAAMQARLVTLTGTLTLAAGISVVVGKTDRKVAVAGLKKGDGITVTPTIALPGNMTLGDAYCVTDGELSLSTIVTGTLALSIAAKTEIPLIVKALR